MARKRYVPQKRKGGAWKLAYADFTTSMMCFFLVMWIINSRTKQDREMMADYFNNKLNVVTMPKNASNYQYSGSKTKTPYKDIESVMLQMSDARIVSLMQKIIFNNASVSYDVLPGGIAVQIVNPNRYEPVFDTGSSTLTPYGKNLIFNTLQSIKMHYKGNIAVIGHSDMQKFANDKYGSKNVKLSIDRAMAVRSFIIKSVQIDHKKILYVAGAGINNIGDYSDNSRRYLNRRVTFMLLEVEKMIKYFQKTDLNNKN